MKLYLDDCFTCTFGLLSLGYRIAGNICGNYIIQFYVKINASLFAELNCAFWDRAVSCRAHPYIIIMADAYT